MALFSTYCAADGEVTTYHDDDGFHAERWDEAKQLIVAQSGDWPTEREALDAVGCRDIEGLSAKRKREAAEDAAYVAESE